MKSSLLPIFSTLLASLILSSCGMAQDPQPSATIGRPLDAAPLESSNSSDDLPDAVEEIPEVTHLDASNLDPDSNLKSEPGAFSAVFEGPCHFAGQMNDVTRSLIIYEGMQVVVKKTGKYEVSLIAEAPQIPVVVYLQLRITELALNGRYNHGTITLPPIVIEPGRDLSHQHPSSTIRIRRTGYSHLLHRLMQENEGNAAELSFTRTGVARFGSIPEAANYATASKGTSGKDSQSN